MLMTEEQYKKCQDCKYFKWDKSPCMEFCSWMNSFVEEIYKCDLEEYKK